jgi:hypothetical protein
MTATAVVVTDSSVMGFVIRVGCRLHCRIIVVRDGEGTVSRWVGADEIVHGGGSDDCSPWVEGECYMLVLSITLFRVYFRVYFWR